jgi:cadmium resistance protein CadD (predicted permease)
MPRQPAAVFFVLAADSFACFVPHFLSAAFVTVIFHFFIFLRTPAE